MYVYVCVFGGAGTSSTKGRSIMCIPMWPGGFTGMALHTPLRVVENPGSKPPWPHLTIIYDLRHI